MIMITPINILDVLHFLRPDIIINTRNGKERFTIRPMAVRMAGLENRLMFLKKF